MIITPLSINPASLHLGDSGAPRASGLHASTIYNSLYQDLEPDRYKADRPMEPLLLETGIIFEDILEEGLKRRFVEQPGSEMIERPEPLRHFYQWDSRQGWLTYSPDLFIYNGETRIGEIKATWLSSHIPHEWLTDIPQYADNIADAIKGNEKLDKYWCVSPDTLITTSDLRQICAENVVVGDRLIGVDEFSKGHKRHFCHTTVTRVKRIRKHCIRLHLEDGTTVVSSDDHQWFSSLNSCGPVKWRRTDTLSQEYRAKPFGRPRVGTGLLSRCFPEVWKSSLDERDLGYLGGILDGEGCLIVRVNSSFNQRLIIGQKPGLVLSKVKALLLEDGYRFTEVIDHTGCSHLNLSNKQDIFRLLATTRPVRLLNKFKDYPLPGLSYNRVKIVYFEPLGFMDVIAIETDAHTYIANGLVSHNCQIKFYGYMAGIRLGRLYACFIAGDYSRPYKSQLVPVDIEFTDDELESNYAMCMNHAVHRRLI